MSRIVHLALNAADHLVSKGRLDAAASILRNYLSTNRPEPQVLQRLGRIYLAQGRSSEAVPLLQQALNGFAQSDNPAQSANSTSETGDQAPADVSSAESVPGAQFIATH